MPEGNSETTTNAQKEDRALRVAVRPIVTILCTFFLAYFYTMETLGYTVPVAINSFWIPVLWWYKDRHDKRLAE